jgi:ABC-type uncharacterized transport system substrate-binding protein
MRRREFITLIGGAAAGWPLAAQAQRMRRIGVLVAVGDDPESRGRITAFVQALQELGWTEGRDIRIDARWGGGDPDRFRRYAAELVALAPDVILVSGGSGVGPMLQATRTVPIVFVQVTDPVGAGFVDSLARPGGNATGFTHFEYGISAKWLELLKQIAPGVTRAAVLRDPAIASGVGQFAVIQSVAPPLGVELTPVNVRDAEEIERAVTAFAQAALASGASGQRGNSIARAHSASEDARERAGNTRPEPGSSARGSNGGLIVTASALAVVHRDLIITLAARHKLPAIFPFRFHVTGGGLISYGPDTVDPHRRAAGYVDRILKGEKPADLPVQAPTRYELVINLKTAKALGIDVPPALLVRADEVIE